MSDELRRDDEAATDSDVDDASCDTATDLESDSASATWTYSHPEHEFEAMLEKLRGRFRSKHAPNLTNADVMMLLERIYGPTHPELAAYQATPGARERLERRGLVGRREAPVRRQYGTKDQQEHLLSVLAVLEHRMQAGVGVGLPWTATVTLIWAANSRRLDPRFR